MDQTFNLVGPHFVGKNGVKDDRDNMVFPWLCRYLMIVDHTIQNLLVTLMGLMRHLHNYGTLGFWVMPWTNWKCRDGGVKFK